MGFRIAQPLLSADRAKISLINIHTVIICIPQTKPHSFSYYIYIMSYLASKKYTPKLTPSPHPILSSFSNQSNPTSHLISSSHHIFSHSTAQSTYPKNPHININITTPKHINRPKSKHPTTQANKSTNQES